MTRVFPVELVRRTGEVLSTRLAEARQICTGIVAELTDQNAYRRHLAAHGLTHSPEAWRRFQDEHLKAKSRRGRCC